jgi:hypothetical protein
VPGIFYTEQLTQTSRPPQGSRWETVEAYFPETQVFATFSLSMYETQNDAQFAGFQRRFAEAYIVSSETPVIVVGGVSVPTRRDNTVYLKTGHLTFHLQVENASASAVFSIYDTSQAARFELVDVENRLDLVVYDEAGNVVRKHSAVQLPGGAAIYAESVREDVLGEALARDEERTLDIAVIDPEEIPDGLDFRIDLLTRRPVPLA